MEGLHRAAQLSLGQAGWGHLAAGVGWGGVRSHGWGDGHSRVGLDTDVVLGNKPLGAPELGLVPVLVVFHVQDLWVGETGPLGQRGETAVNC